MVKEMLTRSGVAWDREYQCKGRLWGGTPQGIPPFLGGMKVLEVGCGDGKNLAALATRGVEITAFDLSPSAISLAQVQVRQGLRADLLVADGRSLPFRAGSFDAVILYHVAGHLRSGDRAVLAAACRDVIRSGGDLFFRGFSCEDLRAGKGARVEEDTYLRGNGILTHYFMEEEVASLFSGMIPRFVTTHRWTMPVRGEPLVRAEVLATFQKP
ncbi:class I SAM-dependent methyltransferase [Methanosphaerula palustris]|uniref:Methyltransferase type 11 n=1 Tax=Methanosphaerula palustris (strain ATCC BAA-1556 / DSM 19958 / E1-9c) TaxID=521011 RepID=B8GK15_METPE|nr:class I SAM-dependent methyltransferase [Methanosphaerula palustris]ACL17086.1 Methyltransferase type 11 [Methanosphaerula palustris E1-9c]